jgi:hypothetical protein
VREIDLIYRLVVALKGISQASNAPVSSWDADGRAVSRSGAAVNTPSRKSQGFSGKPPKGLWLETDTERFTRLFNVAQDVLARLAVVYAAEQWLLHIHKRPPYRDHTTESLKARIMSAPLDVGSSTIAVEEGVSVQYVNRIRATVRSTQYSSD